jgi:SAM-dependent methyltransferase
MRSRNGDAVPSGAMAGDPRDPGCACKVGNEFGEASARRDLRAYRRSGPERTTEWLIDALSIRGVEGMTVLDIGAGVGAVHLALLRAGATSALDVDGSAAFVAVAREEAGRQAVADRVAYRVGDFVELADGVEEADVVALDKVLCCYPDMIDLVARSTARARRRYGVVYPRDAAWIRAGGVFFNGVLRLFRRRLRMYIHRTADVEARIAAAGLQRTYHRTTAFWQVAVFERVEGAA